MMKQHQVYVVACAFLMVACSGENNDLPEVESPPDTSLAYEGDDSVRPPYRAGKDYPGERVELDQTVTKLLQEAGDFEARKAFAIVTPHAGFAFSGHVQATAFARIEMPDTVIMITPKHHGEGESPAFWDDGPFIIPGHAVELRKDLIERFQELAPEEAPHDPEAFLHTRNHPLENQLPWITTMNPDAKIVPFAIYDNSARDFVGWDPERVEQWGKALADLIRELEEEGEEVLVVTSTDLVHRIPLADSDIRDAKLMEHIVNLDVQGLYDYTVESEVSICGEIPVAVTMAAAVELGYTKTELTLRDTSFHKQQNPDSVVGYGSAIFWPEAK